MLLVFRKIKSIKVKLLLQFGLLIFLSSCLVLVMIYSMDLIKRYNHLNIKTIEISKQLLALQKVERDFATQDIISEEFHKLNYSKNVRLFNSLLKDECYRIALIEHETLIRDVNYQDSLQYVVKQLGNYNVMFNNFVVAIKKRGLKNWGDEGKLRNSIHAIEKSGLHFDPILMLTLRRHEKDFFLRKDTTYVTKFNQTLAQFEASFLPAESQILNEHLSNYKLAFYAMVNNELKIGTNNNHGLRKDLSQTFNSTEPILNRLSDVVRVRVEQTIKKTYFTLAVVFIVQFVIALIIAFVFSLMLTDAIKRLAIRIKSLSEGQFPEKIIVKTNDELAQTSLAFNNLMERIKAASYFATRIGKGEYDVVYPKEFSNDVLSDALQGMHVLLKKSNYEKEKRNWLNVGINSLNIILQQEELNTKDLSKKILNKVVRYINASQAQLYLKKSGNAYPKPDFLELTATYGLDQLLELNNTIEIGEGLIGEVWRQKEKQYITSVPDTFFKVSSGLGVSLPTCVLIIPLIHDKEVQGVIEIASLKAIDSYSVELVERLADLLANVLSRSKDKSLVY